MTSMSIGASTPFTVHDLEGMPDDDRRYELIDGELLVRPAPGLRHQTIAYQLHRLLDDACPDDLYVIAAPFAVQTDVSNEVQPDVLVARLEELTDKNLPAAPVLAVEVLSPSGRLIDLNLKRAAYQRMGTPSYWVLDPDVPDRWFSNSTPTADMRSWPGWSATRSLRHTSRSKSELCRPSYSDASIPTEWPGPSARSQSDGPAPRRPIDVAMAPCLPFT
jgi:Uma2 family endonuclease